MFGNVGSGLGVVVVVRGKVFEVFMGVGIDGREFEEIKNGIIGW